MISTERAMIWRYYAYRVSVSNGFFIPVGILYILERGLDLDAVGITQGAFLLALVTWEIPTGYLGDRLGRRRALILGSTTIASVMALYPFADSLLAFVALFVLWAFGATFRSGTAEAWLYDVLQERFDESEFTRIDGRGKSLMFGTSAVTAASAGVLFTVDPRLPFFANAAMSALGIPVLLSLPKVESTGEDGDPFSVQDAVRALRMQVRKPQIRWLVLYVSLFFVVFDLARAYEQPAAEAVGMPVVVIGFMYSGFKLMSAGASALAGPVAERVGVRKTFVLLLPIVGLSYLTVVAVPGMIIFAFFVLRGLRSLTRPIQDQYFNDRLETTGRATALSGIAMTMSVAGGIAQLLAGFVVTRTGVIDLLVLSGFAVTAVAALLWVSTSPVRTPDSSGSDPRPAATD